MEKVLSGRVICPGIVAGKAHVLIRDIAVPHLRLAPNRIAAEAQRYDEAVRRVRDHLREHVQEAHRHSGADSLKILDIHELMLGDEQFHAAVRGRLTEGLLCPEWALSAEAEALSGRLQASGDPYLQARVEDVWDMVYNLLAALRLPAAAYAAQTRPSAAGQILVSKNLFISEVMKTRNTAALGLVTTSRALSSHAAILLRSFNIPSLGAVQGLEEAVRSGEELILDALRGRLVVRPAEKTRRAYAAARRRQRASAPGDTAKTAEARTVDGSRVRLLANIDNPDQTQLLLRNGLEGIGLFRTEFLLLGTEQLPGEEQQYEVYRQVMESMKNRSVVIRSFDLGADKRLPYLDRCLAANPSLGIRGIRRHLLRRPEELHTQLRAVIRAAAGRSVDILIPMVTTLDEITWVKELLQRVRTELAAEHRLRGAAFRLGAMIEVPAAAFAVGSMLAAVDFLSIGTNDLIQYFTAADRDNEAVQHYGDLRNEAVLFMLRYIAEQAQSLGRAEDLTVCGEAASAPENVELLLRMGYRSLSISPIMAPCIREAVRAVRL